MRKAVVGKGRTSRSKYFVSNLGNAYEAYKVVFQQAAIAILILKDNIFIDCNKKAEELFGYSKDEIVGHTPGYFSPKVQPDGVLSSDKASEILSNVKHDTPAVFEWVHQRSDDTQFIAKISLNTFELEGEQLFIVFIDDVTDFKRNIVELNIYKSDLESIVAERNKELTDLNQRLSLTVEELNATNSELVIINDELNKTLKSLNKEIQIRKELHELLVLNQEKFKSFIDQSSEGISIIDSNAKVIEWNRAIERITGISYDDAINKNIFDLNFNYLPENRRTPETFQRLREEVMGYIANIDKRSVEFREAEIEVGNEKKIISTVLFPIKLSKGYLVGRITRDVTSSKLAEIEIKRYRDNLEEIIVEKTGEIEKLSRRYFEIFNNTSDGIAIVSKDFKLLEANPALQNMLQQSDEELYVGDIFDSIPENFHDVVTGIVESLFKGDLSGNLEIEIINSKGDRIPVELSANIIEYKNEKALLSIIRDISERREMEKLIIRTTIEVEERERRRLAADLHDDIGPLLASLKMYVSVLQQKLNNTSYSEIIEIILNLIKSSIDNIRTISNNISPHLIERFGLISALQAEVDNYKLLMPINFKTNSVGFKFDKQIEIIIYRIIKELINNTVKYAKANEINLTINYQNSVLLIDYSDNGVGFDFKATTNDKNLGHGLNNIDNRIKSINGIYTIDTAVGKGILFKLEVPVNLR